MYFRSLIALALAAVAGTGTAQNSNEDSPHAMHVLAFADGTEITVSYRQLTLAGGSSLRQLMSKGDNGARFRAFYNDQYLPSVLDGKLALSTPMKVGDADLAKGKYTFTFRIDDELTWHLVVSSDDTKVADLALEAGKESSTEHARLIVRPVATQDRPEGKLEIRYGPLRCAVAFAAPAQPADKTGERPGGGK